MPAARSPHGNGLARGGSPWARMWSGGTGVPGVAPLAPREANPVLRLREGSGVEGSVAELGRESPDDNS